MHPRISDGADTTLAVRILECVRDYRSAVIFPRGAMSFTDLISPKVALLGAGPFVHIYLPIPASQLPGPHMASVDSRNPR
jgi:hypothetical protein